MNMSAHAIPILLISLCGAVSPPAGESGQNEADFPAGTLAQVIASHREEFKDEDFVLDAAPEGISAVVTWSSEIRLIPAERVKFLERYARAFKAGAFIDSYREEIRVTEEGKSFWIPCQSELVEFIRKEQRAGARLKLRLRLLGAMNRGKDTIFVMVGYSPLALDDGRPNREPSKPAPGNTASAPRSNY